MAKVDDVKNELETHKAICEERREQYEKDMAEINKKIGGIFRRLDSMSSRWLFLSGSVIMILLGTCGYLFSLILEKAP